MGRAAGLRAWTPAQVGALVLGSWWILNGIAVLGFGDPGLARLGGHGEVTFMGHSIAANGWHGLFHLSTGLAGLCVCVRPALSRAYAIVVGGLYVALAAWGLISGQDTVAAVLYVDVAGSIEHLVEGTVLLTAGLVSSDHKARAT